VVWGREELRTALDSLRMVPIEIPGGGHVPLGDVADITIVPAPNEFKRGGASRRIDITCNVRDRNLGTVAREIEQRGKSLSFDHGYPPEFLGEYAARSEWRNHLFASSAVALVGILLLLHADFRSFRLALLVFLTLPFALIGGVIAAFLIGGTLSLGSLVGFATVLGIAARNGIMLVSHYQHLEQEGMNAAPDLILQGLVPILMTALSAGLGLLPLVVGGNRPGHEIEYPMAAVILGGLVTSTTPNLLFVPGLFSRFRSVNAAANASNG